MSSTRNVLLLALTSGLGILAFLVVRSDVVLSPETVHAGDRPTVPGRVTAVRDELPPRPQASVLEDLDRRIVEGPPVATGDAGLETTVAFPLEVEFSLGLDQTLDVPDGAEPIRTGANAGILGSVHGAGGKPLPATVTFVHGPNVGRVLRTDVDGRFGASDLWQGLNIIRVETPAGSKVEREVPLASLSTRDFHVTFANMSTLSGTVKNLRGQPVPGAQVTVDGRVFYTNDDGMFTASNVPAGTPLVLVRKEGYALARRSAGLGHRTTVPPENFVVTLHEEARLTLSVGRRAGTDGPSYAVLMPSGGAGYQNRDTGFPWFLVNPIEVPASGSVQIGSLLPGPTRVHVFHRGARVLPASSVVHLDEGRAVSARVDLHPGPSIEGRVFQGDDPVHDAIVTIEAANQLVATTAGIGERNPRSTLALVLPRIPTAQDEVRTDAQGRFLFSRDRDGLTTYYVKARSRDGSRVGAAVVPPGSSSVRVQLSPPKDSRGVAELELPARHQGLPIDLTINGTPRDRFVLRPTEPLRVDDLQRGLWMVSARWRGDIVLMPTPLEVAGTVPTLEIRSLPKGAIHGQTEDELRRAGLIR